MTDGHNILLWLDQKGKGYRKTLMVVALSIILGTIGYFNFGFHDLKIEKVGLKSRPYASAWKKLEKNIKDIQTEVPQEFQDPFLDQDRLLR